MRFRFTFFICCSLPVVVPGVPPAGSRRFVEAAASCRLSINCFARIRARAEVRRPNGGPLAAPWRAPFASLGWRPAAGCFPQERARAREMKIHPGHPLSPLGATYDGVGTEFFAVFRAGRAHRALACLTRPAPRRASTCRRSPPSAGTATCRASAPASATATGCTARTTRPPAIAAIPPSSCLTPTPRRSTGMVEWNEAVFPYHFADPEGSRNDLDSAPLHAQMRGHQPLLRLGERPPAAHPRCTSR